ncbi:MAG TPA: hypothetical protein VLV15_01100 [Dongiaceae bacterium]|nr:hypothetical protein [Dongiaceae bacterium]
MSWQKKALNSGVLCLWLEAPADRPDPQHWVILERSTALIPAAHRHVVRTVELRGHAQVPLRGGGSDQTTGTIRLSHACLRASYNREYNVTLLHEWGHHVDWRYGVAAFARGQGANGQTLLATRHDGVRQGPGERIADCYMIYLLQVVARRHYVHPAEPAAYQGAAARMRFDLLLRSPAFAGVPGVRAQPSL